MALYILQIGTDSATRVMLEKVILTLAVLCTSMRYTAAALRYSIAAKLMDSLIVLDDMVTDCFQGVADPFFIRVKVKVRFVFTAGRMSAVNVNRVVPGSTLEIVFGFPVPSSEMVYSSSPMGDLTPVSNTTGAATVVMG